MMLKILILLTLFLLPDPVPALVVEGTTHAGMTFHGKVQGMDRSSLHLAGRGNKAASIIGIPLKSIRELRLLADPSANGLLQELGTNMELLPLLQPESLKGIMTAIHDLAQTGDWPQCYQWTLHILKTNPPAGISRRLRLWQAWALHEMKLHDEARRLLETLVKEWDPLEAPILLCWLMAKLAERDSAHSKVLYWSLLPSLQIPAADGPFSVELLALADECLLRENQHTP